MRLRLSFVVALVLVSGLLAAPRPVSAAQQCFPQTGQCIQGRFLDYWLAHGGLAINGYPLTGEYQQRLEDGKTYTVQYFERVRMEYHPENAAPNDVLLGQFGRLLHPADPPAAQKAGMAFFSETGHNVDARFMAYWNANGGLPQFGYPLGELITETLEDGHPYQVQYFERARFEYHPENPAPYDVLLGQFGRRILASIGQPPAPPAPSPSPSPAPAPLPVGSDDAFKQYLRSHFGMVGTHQLQLEDVAIFHVGSGSDDSIAVWFDTTPGEVTYMYNQASKAELQAWGAALLQALKQQYPNRFVMGDLAWSYYSYNYRENSDCHYTSSSITSGKEWYQSAIFVEVAYMPGAGDNALICAGK